MSIQYRYGTKITLLEEADKLSKKDILQRLDDTFDLGPKTKKTVINAINNKFDNMGGKALLSIIIPLLINMTSCQSTGGNSDDCDTETHRKLEGDLYEKYKEWDYNNDSILDDDEIAQYSIDDTQRTLDSLKSASTDKYVENSKNNSGIDIIDVKIVNIDDYTDYKGIKIKYTNNTGKDISAISFKWTDLKDIFDEDIEAILSKGGYDDEGLRKGGTTSGTWDLKENKVKSAKVYVQKIMFTDGTKWVNEIR